MLFLSQVCFFSCMFSNSSSLFFRFLFSLINSFNCRACWSKLLVLFFLLYYSNLYYRALFLWAISRTYFFNVFIYYVFAFSTSYVFAIVSIWSFFFLLPRVFSSFWYILMNWFTLLSSFLTSSSCCSRLGVFVLFDWGIFVFSKILLTVSPSSYN